MDRSIKRIDIFYISKKLGIYKGVFYTLNLNIMIDTKKKNSESMFSKQKRASKFEALLIKSTNYLH